LTLKVPDGRGNLVAGCTFANFEKRHAWREQFESMRLLYVAATRAEDRLILSGVTDELASLGRGNDCWLKWIWQALELEGKWASGLVELDDDVQLQLTVNLGEEEELPVAESPVPEHVPDFSYSLTEVFPLIRPVERPIGAAVHRFSVTQLINYHRCPRQYYFDRILQLPSMDELAVWNNADAPEPPSNLTATLKGAVIHRFCERYTPDQDVEECLRRSFDEVVRLRQAQLADRLVEINLDAAIKDLLPLAKNYLASDVFKRLTAASESELSSERSFRLRRPLGILYGVIDKLLIGDSAVEIIDFKTNRIRGAKKPAPEPKAPQFAFNFEMPSKTSFESALQTTTEDYQLQMQAYALAVRSLVPGVAEKDLRVTLHFLEPNVEVHLSDELLNPARCEAAVDEAMLRIITSAGPQDFPVKPAPHCRACNFLRLCTAGKEWIRDH
jgi:ATP-dependent helicase/nuclease subunit A